MRVDIADLGTRALRALLEPDAPLDATVTATLAARASTQVRNDSS